VYAIHLDSQCVPVGDAPVYAFWHMQEKGPAVIEPLLSRVERAYGIASQRVLVRGTEGWQGRGHAPGAIGATRRRGDETQGGSMRGMVDAPDRG
jgi:hypothetical protein